MIFQAAKSGHWFQIPNFFLRLIGSDVIAWAFCTIALPGQPAIPNPIAYAVRWNGEQPSWLFYGTRCDFTAQPFK